MRMDDDIHMHVTHGRQNYINTGPLSRWFNMMYTSIHVSWPAWIGFHFLSSFQMRLTKHLRVAVTIRMVTMWITGYDTQRSRITLWELAERANSTSLFTINTNIKTALVKMWYADHLIEISIENANSTSKDEHVKISRQEETYTTFHRCAWTNNADKNKNKERKM